MTGRGPRRVVGIRFQRAGRVHYFDARELDLQANDRVVAETDEGEALGSVVIGTDQLFHHDLQQPLRPILRKANPEDEAPNFRPQP